MGNKSVSSTALAKDVCTRCKGPTGDASRELCMFNSHDGRSLAAKLCAKCYDDVESLVLGHEDLETGGIPAGACCPYMGTPECVCNEDCGCGAELEGALSAGRHTVGAHNERRR